MIKMMNLAIYMIIMPIALGIVSSVFLGKVNEERSYHGIEFLLLLYTRGLVVEFSLFEVLYLLFLREALTYDLLLEKFMYVWKVASMIALLLGVILLVVKFILKEQDLNIRFKLDKQVFLRYGFILLYILIAVLFVLPSQTDNTVNQLVDVTRYGVISNHFVVFYLLLSNLIGIGIVPFVHYILNLFLLIFFFGIYESVERIIIRYNKDLKAYVTLIEVMFSVFMVLLLFIRGSIYTSIPQNIWNPKTILASCIFPLVFFWGYEFILDKKVGFFVKMMLMMLVTNMFYNNGWIFIWIPIGVAMIMVVKDRFKIRRIEN